MPSICKFSSYVCIYQSFTFPFNNNSKKTQQKRKKWLDLILTITLVIYCKSNSHVRLISSLELSECKKSYSWIILKAVVCRHVIIFARVIEDSRCAVMLFSPMRGGGAVGQGNDVQTFMEICQFLWWLKVTGILAFINCSTGTCLSGARITMTLASIWVCFDRSRVKLSTE